MSNNHIDTVECQENWKLDNSNICGPGYKWFSKPRKGIKGKRAESGVGFLVGELSMKDVTINENVKCNESIWLRIMLVSWVDSYVR